MKLMRKTVISKKSIIRRLFYKLRILRILLYYLLKTKRVLKRRGWLFLIKKLLWKVRHAVFATTSSVWLERSLEEPIDVLSPEIDIAISFLVSDKGSLIDWLDEKRDEFPWIYFKKEIEVAKADDHIFVLLLYRETIIGYIKVGKKHVYVHDFDSIISFPWDTAFLYDIFILPEYRGKRLALYAIERTMIYLRERQFKKMWCHIEKWNQASRKTFVRAGFREKGSIRFAKLCGFPLFIKDRYKPMINLEGFICKG